MRKHKKIEFMDIVTIILAMLILAFVIAMIAGYSRYSGFGFFKAIQLSWCDICDWIGETVFGMEIGYKADVEFPIVNAHISIISYWR